MVKTSERRLYFVVGNGQAIRYPVAVGRPASNGRAPRRSTASTSSPPGRPPTRSGQDNPKLPNVIPGGASNNPMGPRAMTLSGGEYAIHGTNRPYSIGTFASYGCIRMYNQDIVDLFERVGVGTEVVVIR